MKDAGKISLGVMMLMLVALFIFLVYRRIEQAGQADNGMLRVSVSMILAPLVALIAIYPTYWFKYHYPEDRRDEVITKFNVWKRGNTRGAKLWRGFNILTLICLVLYTLLRVLGLADKT